MEFSIIKTHALLVHLMMIVIYVKNQTVHVKKLHHYDKMTLKFTMENDLFKILI